MRRIYINIAAFLVLTTATIAWSAINFLHLDIIEDPYFVTADFEETPGLRAGYEVTYLGHAVGRIRAVDLAPGTSEVRLAIDRDVVLPADVTAAARRRSAIGEPYVDLAPAPGTDPDSGPRLSDGDRIPVAQTTSPLQYGDLFRSLATLVDTIDTDALATLTDEAAIALDGRGPEIRRIVDSTEALVTTIAANRDDIGALIDGVATIADVLATNRDALGSGIDSLASLTDTLEQARPAVETLLDDAPSTIALLNAIVDASDDAIICIVDGTAALDAIIDAETARSLTGLLQRSAAFADVVRAVQDPRDGLFRIFVSPSTGNPPVVEYLEPRAFPTAPPVPECPEHAVATAPTPMADEAGPDDGGRQPTADFPTSTPDRPEERAATPISGTSDITNDASTITRLVRSLWPWLPAAIAAVTAVWFIRLSGRRRGGQP